MDTLRSRLEGRTGIKAITRNSYQRLLKDFLDTPAQDADPMAILDTKSNPNTKRATAIALRALGFDVKIPRGFPRVYDLPDEETLRLVLSYSRKHEVRFLTMMYLGLRIGEAAWVSRDDVMPGNRIYINEQVAEWQDNGWQFEVRAPKSSPAVIDCPPWLADRLPPRQDRNNPVRPYQLRAALHYVSNRYLGRTLNAHALRHWFATTMLTKGTPLPVVQRQMRHADIAVTLRTYAQFSGTRMSLFDNDIV